MTKKTAVINEEIENKLSILIAGTDDDFMANSRVLTKSIGRDAKFSKWLKSGGELGIKLFTDGEYRKKVLDVINGNHTDLDQKRALVIKLLRTTTDSVIASKDKDVTKGIVLSEAQKAEHSKVLGKFASNVERQAKVALMEIALEYGIVEIVQDAAETKTVATEPVATVNQ